MLNVDDFYDAIIKQQRQLHNAYQEGLRENLVGRFIDLYT